MDYMAGNICHALHCGVRLVVRPDTTGGWSDAAAGTDSLTIKHNVVYTETPLRGAAYRTPLPGRGAAE